MIRNGWPGCTSIVPAKRQRRPRNADLCRVANTSGHGPRQAVLVPRHRGAALPARGELVRLPKIPEPPTGRGADAVLDADPVRGAPVKHQGARRRRGAGRRRSRRCHAVVVIPAMKERDGRGAKRVRVNALAGQKRQTRRLTCSASCSILCGCCSSTKKDCATCSQVRHSRSGKPCWSPSNLQ